MALMDAISGNYVRSEAESTGILGLHLIYHWYRKEYKMIYKGDFVHSPQLGQVEILYDHVIGEFPLAHLEMFHADFGSLYRTRGEERGIHHAYRSCKYCRVHCALGGWFILHFTQRSLFYAYFL